MFQIPAECRRLFDVDTSKQAGLRWLFQIPAECRRLFDFSMLQWNAASPDSFKSQRSAAVSSTYEQTEMLQLRDRVFQFPAECRRLFDTTLKTKGELFEKFQIPAECSRLFDDENNYTDAVVIAFQIPAEGSRLFDYYG